MNAAIEPISDAEREALIDYARARMTYAFNSGDEATARNAGPDCRPVAGAGDADGAGKGAGVMSNGYVYVLSNPSMPGLLKIGRSINGGKKRASEIYQTGVPTPFYLEFEILVDDPAYIESAVHEKLSDRRVNGSREFFKADVTEAIEAILSEYVTDFDMSLVSFDEAAAVDGLNDHITKLGLTYPEVISFYHSTKYLNEDSLREAVLKYEEKSKERKLRVIGDINGQN